ncbi:hypothetical protein ACS0TY_007517 [Phlomoides rotata]
MIITFCSVGMQLDNLVCILLKKVTVVVRILTYGVPADATDEYIKIGESTTIECLERFCRSIMEIFGEQFLRTPIQNDVARLLHF